MSLYGDLPQAKDEDTGSKGWAAASKKLQPTFRKPSNLLAPPSVARGGPGRAGGRTATPSGRGAGRGPPPASVNTANAGQFGAQQQQQQQAGHANPAPAPIHSATSFFTSLTGEPLQDEYDPSKPNDYEEIMKQREKKRREADEETERLARMREIEQEIERRKREQAEAAAFIAAASQPPPGVDPAALKTQTDEDEEAAHTFQGLGSSSGGGSAAAAAAGAGSGQQQQQQQQKQEDMEVDEYEKERQRRLKLSGDDAFRARARISGASPADFPPGPSDQQQQQQYQPPPGFSSGGGGSSSDAAAAGGKGMPLAQKLLEKMGWRQGQGLGRFRQGMSTPLVAQKTAAHAGVIVNADGQQVGDKKPRGAAFRGVPTRVLLLANMVGPGEVDEDLEEEVGTELSKYGSVEDVMIFEVLTPGFAAEETVRIFIKFDRAEAATRALVDLQGRYFGGRQVRAAFFSEDRFDKQQLAPQPGEFD